jgi:hypothetical protein
MIYREIITEAKRLPKGEQLQLIEELLSAMRPASSPITHKSVNSAIPFIKLRGALKPESAAVSDVLKEDYAQYLVEKYL